MAEKGDLFMDKVLIWGTNSVYAMNRDVIRQLTVTGEIEVLALIDNNADKQEIDGYCVINQEMIKNYDFDYIILAVSTLIMPEIIKIAYSVGIPKSKIISICDLLSKKGISEFVYRQRVNVQKKVLTDILNSTEQEIHDYQWLYSKILEFGIYLWGGKQWQENPEANYFEQGLMQIPEEFAGYCQLLSWVKASNAIEIGVYRGRSSYFMCAVLARINPDIEYIMVDIIDRADAFDEYQEIVPNLKKVIPSTSKDFYGKRYDVVFIDADHSYDASIADWKNIGQFANMITGFHDIYAHEYDKENGGTVRMWLEVAETVSESKKRIFSKYPDEWMGIGCILFDKNLEHKI